MQNKLPLRKDIQALSYPNGVHGDVDASQAHYEGGSQPATQVELEADVPYQVTATAKVQR